MSGLEVHEDCKLMEGACLQGHISSLFWKFVWSLSTFCSQSLYNLLVPSILDINKVQPTPNKPLEEMRSERNVLILQEKEKKSLAQRCKLKTVSHKDKCLTKYRCTVSVRIVWGGRGGLCYLTLHICLVFTSLFIASLRWRIHSYIV